MVTRTVFLFLFLFQETSLQRTPQGFSPPARGFSDLAADHDGVDEPFPAEAGWPYLPFRLNSP